MTSVAGLTYEEWFAIVSSVSFVALVVLSLLGSCFAANSCFCNNRIGDSSDTHSDDNCDDNEEQATGTLWWAKIRVILDILRLCGIALVIMNYHYRFFLLSISCIPLAVYDLLILVVLVAWKNEPPHRLRKGQKVLMLLYTLLAGFPIGTLTKIMIAVHYDFEFKLFSLIILSAPYIIWIPTLFLILFFYLFCCKCKDCDEPRCCIRYFCGMLMATTAMGIIAIATSLCMYHFLQAGTLSNSTSLAITDETATKMLSNTIVKPLLSMLPSITWAVAMAPLWVALFIILLVYNSFFGSLLVKGEKNYALRIFPDLLVIYGFTATAALICFYLDQPNTPTTSWWWVAWLPAYPLWVTEVVCLIIGFVIICMYRRKLRKVSPQPSDEEVNTQSQTDIRPETSGGKIKYKQASKLMKTPIDKWETKHVVQWMEKVGKPLTNYKNKIKKQKLTGILLRGYKKEDYDNLGITDPVHLLKFKTEFLKEFYLQKYDLKQFGGKDEGWANSWISLADTNETKQKNIINIDKDWVVHWLKHIGVDAFTQKEFHQNSVGGMMLFALELDQQGRIAKTMNLSELDVLLIDSGRTSLDLVKYDAKRFDFLVEKAKEYDDFDMLFPFWDMNGILKWAERKKFFVGGKSYAIHGGIFHPEHYRTDFVMGSLGHENSDEDAKHTLVEKTINLCEQTMKNNQEIKDKVRPKSRGFASHALASLSKNTGPKAYLTNGDFEDEFFMHLFQEIVFCVDTLKRKLVKEREKTVQQLIKKQKTFEMTLSKKERAENKELTDRIPEHWKNYPKNCQTVLALSNLQTSAQDMKHPVGKRIEQAIKDIVARSWNKTERDPEILEVVQIQNAKLWHSYASKKQQLLMKASDEPFIPIENIPNIRPKPKPVLTKQLHVTALDTNLDADVNEYYFFHGTSAHAVDAIVGNGLDFRMAANFGYFGRGIYGAESAALSDDYARSDNNEYFMFVIRMMLGRSYITYKERKDFKRPPCREPGCMKFKCLKHNDFFDSVVGKLPTRNYREFLVYDQSLCYPEFLFKYTTRMKECPICKDVMKQKNTTTLTKCKHTFCKECLARALQIKNACPVCNDILGSTAGNQPPGTMTSEVLQEELPGYSGSHTIQITYNFQNGVQTQEHPNPGQPYQGTQRVAYLPDTPEGNEVLGLLVKAFDARMTFTIGRSVTTGQDNSIVWNDIHHKTSKTGGPTEYGYPDSNYLDRVKQELAAKGIQ